jgi:hypothetical protein
MANFRQYSRYISGKIATNRSGQNFLVLRRPLNLIPASGDIFVTVTQEMEHRPDLVAQSAYGNPDLWWVIYEFNGIRDPLFGLRAGQILRLPELERVLGAIQDLED